MPGTVRSFWPDLHDNYSARQAIKMAWQAAFLVSALTALAAVAALFFWPFLGIDAESAFFAATFMLVAGWRLRHHSRAWAIVVLCFWAANLVAQVIALTETGSGGAGLMIGVLILIAFINGVRRTFALRKYPKKAIAVTIL